jgi:hypothetical protein
MKDEIESHLETIWTNYGKFRIRCRKSNFHKANGKIAIANAEMQAT